MLCEGHKMKYVFTCPVCEIELEYVSRTHLLPYFRSGVLGEKITVVSNEEKEAYQHGLKLRKGKSNG